MSDIVDPKNLTTGPVPKHSHTAVTGGITQLTTDVLAGPGSGSQVATIPPNTVTYAKMQDVSAASRLLGRGGAAGAGDPEEITLGSNLSMSGTTLNATDTTGITQLTGDVTAGPGSGSVAATIPNNTVTYAKMQDVSAASRLLGRGSAAGSGDPEEISLGTGLSMSGTTLSSTVVGGITELTGDVTAGPGSGSQAATIANNAVTNAKLRDSGALSVIGRSANSSGDPADISASAASDAVLRESGSVVGFGTVATAGIADNAVTYAKMQDVSAASRLIGRGSAAGSGDPQEITLGSGLSMSGTSLIAGGGGGSGGSIGRPNDPLTTSYEYEDFLGNVGSTGQIGKLGWAFVNSTVAFVASVASHPGIIQKLQNNNAGSISLGFATGTFMLLPSMFFDCYFTIRPQTFDGNLSIWAGYQDSTTATGDAGNMICFQALNTDTNWFTSTRIGSGTVQRQNTTIACTTGNWYTMRIRRIDASTIGFTVVTVNGAASGVSEFTETTAIPTTTLGWALRLRSHTASDRICEIDYWDQLITGLTR